VRYLCHLNSPEKYQYDPNDILALNDAKIDALLETSAAQKIETFRELRDYVNENGMYEYADLVDRALDSGDDAMFQMLYDKPSFYDAYMRSVSRRRVAMLNESMRIERERLADGKVVDTETGEVLC
jgi:hypothetical protein